MLVEVEPFQTTSKPRRTFAGLLQQVKPFNSHHMYTGSGRVQRHFSCLTRKFCYFCRKFLRMRLVLTILFFQSFTLPVQAQNEVGPEGHKLIWFALVMAVAGIIAFFLAKSGKGKLRFNAPSFKRKKVEVELIKDRLYYPGFLELTLTNSGNTAADIDTPLLVFSSIWLNRKFKLKGTNNYNLYPLYLEKGQNHTLTIELDRFYRFDKTLKRLPRVKVIVSEVNGKKLGSRQVLLRKTLFNI